MEPDNAKAHARMGRAQFELGRIGEAKASYDRAAELDPKLKELKSRWRVDVALHKLSKNSSGSAPAAVSPAAKQKQAAKVVLQEVSRETWQLWMSAKPNPAFLHESADHDEDIIGRSFQDELRKRSIDNNVQKISRMFFLAFGRLFLVGFIFFFAGAGQRAYNAGELIMMRNDDLSPAADLVSEYAGDPPNSGLEPLFLTGKSVMMWTGKSWKTHSLALYETCFFAKSVGFFLLDDFAAWFNGMTHREHHYIVLEQKDGKVPQKLAGQPNVLGFVFVEKEEFLAMIQWLKKLMPQQ